MRSGRRFIGFVVLLVLSAVAAAATGGNPTSWLLGTVIGGLGVMLLAADV